MSQFTEANGQILDPNGNPFVARGINIMYGGNMPSSATLLSDFPGLNFVRVPIYNYESPQTLSAFVTDLTSHGIVVELEDHTNTAGNAGGNAGTIYTGSQLTTELNWYSSVASAFKNNPYVWFGTNNEPSETDASGNQNPGALSDWQLQTYQAVRNAGNSNPVMLEANSWGVNNTNAGYKASDYAGMTNTIWDAHYYGWVSGYSTDQSTVNSTLSGIVQATKSIGNSAGAMPVLIGEYGNSTDGQNTDANGTQVVTAVDQSGLGSSAWAWGTGGNGGADGLLTSSGGLTSYGQQVASFIAAGSGPVAPPPVNPPPAVSPSANDSVITVSGGGSLVDGSGNVWTITSAGAVQENGANAGYSANVSELAYVNGVIWQENTSNLWWGWSNGGWNTGNGTATSPLPSVTPPPPPPAANPLNLTGYHLTFDDEFNNFTSSPDGSKGWATTAFGLRTLSANGEQEYYSDSSVGTNPFSDANGVLTITAAPGSNPQNLPYNSGEITTTGDFAQSTGYFEMRAELPAGQGMWPAFWLMPKQAGTPGEVDTMEAFGAPAPDGEGGTQTYHWGMHAPNSAQNAGAWAPQGVDLTAGYHTYGVDVETDKTTYYFDGKQVSQIATPNGIGSMPLYMIANLAVGGSWPGAPAGETSQMKIDYIRAFSKDPNVAAVAQQPVSSPDGGGTDLYGASVGSQPPTPVPTPTPTPTPAPAPTPSPDDTVVLTGSGKSIIDASGNAWTIAAGGVVQENGANAGFSSNVTEIAYVNGSVWQENASKLWWQWSNGGWSGGNGIATSPLPSAPPPYTPPPSTAPSGTGPVQVSGQSGGLSVVLGSGSTSMSFLQTPSLLVTGGSGTSTLTFDGAANVTVGTGPMSVTEGTNGADVYTVQGGSGALTITDFSAAKGDAIQAPSAVQSVASSGSDGHNGTLLSFGAGVGTVDLQNYTGAVTIAYH